MTELPSQISFLEQGMLEPEDYLTMIEEASDLTRYDILSVIVEREEISATALAEEVGMAEKKSRLHYHLDELEEAELVQNRRANRADSDGFYSYYTPTPYGTTVEEHIAEVLTALVTKEQDIRGQYAELSIPPDDYEEEVDRLEEELEEVREDLKELRESVASQ